MAKIDPRADPVSEPPKGESPSASEDFSVDRVAVPKTDATDKAVAKDTSTESESAVVPVERPPQKKVTSQDPRYEPLEKLLDINDWKKIAEELGSIDDIGKLPPNLGLVAALAHNENAKGGDPEAAGIAIRCMAGVLGVAQDSPIARVLARRMLRKNPVTLRERKAPPAKTSLLIVLVTLVVGSGVGWLLSAGSWRAVARMLHVQ